MLITTITSIDILNLQIVLPERICSTCHIIVTAPDSHYSCHGCLLTYHEGCSTPRTFVTRADKLVSYCNDLCADFVPVVLPVNGSLFSKTPALKKIVEILKKSDGPLLILLNGNLRQTVVYQHSQKTFLLVDRFVEQEATKRLKQYREAVNTFLQKELGANKRIF